MTDTLPRDTHSRHCDCQSNGRIVLMERMCVDKEDVLHCDCPSNECVVVVIEVRSIERMCS